GNRLWFVRLTNGGSGGSGGSAGGDVRISQGGSETEKLGEHSHQNHHSHQNPDELDSEWLNNVFQ
ncbi:MAG: hypothetical protein ACK5YO_32355, partial [Planctomyces sp.]